jgi:hypothetical protein
MERVYGLMLVALLLPATAEARHRTHVRVYKEVPSYQPVVPLAVVPPFAVAFDLMRRTSCDPAVAVATGPNDPGFTSHPAGNYLTPAIYRSECRAAPRRY